MHFYILIHNQKENVKTAEFQIRSITGLIVVNQFPTVDKVWWLHKILSLGKLNEGNRGYL